MKDYGDHTRITAYRKIRNNLRITPDAVLFQDLAEDVNRNRDQVHIMTYYLIILLMSQISKK